MDRRVTRSKAEGPATNRLGNNKRGKTESSLNALIVAGIERKMKQQGKAVHKSSISTEFVYQVETVMEEYLDELVRRLVIVSHHRAGLTTSANLDDEMRATSTTVEEFILYKEDCADYMRKLIAGTAPNSDPPQFSKAEYSSHAAEEEERMILTAQSVRRLCNKDLIPLIRAEGGLKVPEATAQTLINRIAVNELKSDYLSRRGESFS